MSIDKETETDKKSLVVMMKSITKSLVDRVKDKKQLKIITHKSSKKNTEKAKQNSLIEKPMKKSKVEEKITKKKFLKRKPVQTSDSETYDEPNVMDIVTSSRRRIGGKRILFNIPTPPLVNVSFHSEASVQKWKYVF